MLFVARLAQRRSPASAALLFLLLVDEIEGLIYLAVGVVLKRADLFLAVQDIVFPAIVIVAGAVAFARNYRRRKAERLASVEPVDVSVLSERIGSHIPVTSVPQPIPAMSVRSQWATTQSMTGQRPSGVNVAAPHTASQNLTESEYRASIAALHTR